MGIENSKNNKAFCIWSMASSYPNICFWDVHLKLLLVPPFPSCSAPGERRQCQSFAVTVPVKRQWLRWRTMHHCPCTEAAASKTLMNHDWDQIKGHSFLNNGLNWFRFLNSSIQSKKSPAHLKSTWDSCVHLGISPATATLPRCNTQMAPAWACKNQKHNRMAQIPCVEIVPQCRKESNIHGKGSGEGEAKEQQV